MFERFTMAAREVVERTQQIALESRASQVRPEHLFAALLWDDRCLTVRVLNDQGGPSERLHAELDKRRSRYVDGLDDSDAEALRSIGIDLEEVVSRMGDDGVVPRRNRSRAHLRFSRPSKKVLELALREAVALRHHYIGTEHLLLGLVREGDVIVRDTLVAAGVDPTTLRAAVAEAVRQAG
ncbi:MAG: ATP-dependent Clp protease [Marmoricola sp.]|jgi:ATP-dependent Clp protease ATP-binding subunit ClpA|nr:ATP-dependent Clp protease [Marmoricola sp.]